MCHDGDSRAPAPPRQLTDAGVEHETVVYEGAPHSFFDRSFAEWKDAGEDSWRRILGFVS